MTAEDDLRGLLRRAAAAAAGGDPSVDPAGLVAASRRQRRRRQRMLGGGALAAAIAAAVAVPALVGDGGSGEQVQVGGPDTASGADAGWARLPDPPLSPRSGATAVWTGAEVVVVGGWEFLCPPGADCGVPPGVEPFRDGAAFDPATGAWRQIAEAPLGFTGTEAVALNGDVYLLPACSVAPCLGDPTLLRYRPGADEWDALPAPSGDVSGYLLTASAAGLVAYTSSDEVVERPDLRFDPAGNAWTELPDDPFPPLYDRQLVADGDDLLLFGKEVDDPRSPSPVVGARLDSETGTWEPLAPSPGSGFQAWGIDGVVVLNPHFGPGMLGGVFDPEGAVWSTLPQFPVAESWRGDMAGALGTSTAIFEYSSGWVLDVPTGEWLEVPAVDDRTTFPDTAVTAIGRTLFVFGGEDWSGGDGRLLGDAWIWTPARPPDERVPTVVAQEPSESNEGMAALVEGVVHYDAGNDCFLLDGIDGVTYPVVWPAGTAAAEDGDGVVLPDGTTARIGDTVSGGGGYLAATTLDAAIPDACLPPTGEVAVFNPNGAVEVRQP